MPPLSIELKNSFGFHGYTPLCPENQEKRTSRIHVFAMPHSSTRLFLPNNYRAQQLIDQIMKLSLCATSTELSFSLDSIPQILRTSISRTTQNEKVIPANQIIDLDLSQQVESINPTTTNTNIDKTNKINDKNDIIINNQLLPASFSTSNVSEITTPVTIPTTISTPATVNPNPNPSSLTPTLPSPSLSNIASVNSSSSSSSSATTNSSAIFPIVTPEIKPQNPKTSPVKFINNSVSSGKRFNSLPVNTEQLRLPPFAPSLFFRPSTQTEFSSLPNTTPDVDREFHFENTLQGYESGSDSDHMQSQPESQSQPVVYADLEERHERQLFEKEQHEVDSQHFGEQIVQSLSTSKILPCVDFSEENDENNCEVFVVEKGNQSNQRVCFTLHGFKKGEKDAHTSMIEARGGRVDNSVGLTNQVTHIICKSITSNEKILCACLRGIWMLNESYLTHIATQNRFADESLFTFKKDELSHEQRNLIESGIAWKNWYKKFPNRFPLSGLKVLIDVQEKTKEISRIFTLIGAEVIKERPPFSKSDYSQATHVITFNQIDQEYSLPVLDVARLQDFVFVGHRYENPIEFWMNTPHQSLKRPSENNPTTPNKRVRYDM